MMMIHDLGTTLLDEALPRFDYRTSHSRRIAAGPAAVWRAMDRYDLSRDASLPVRTLFRLRGLGVPEGTIRDSLGPIGFTILAERPESEIVAGTYGRFWALRELRNMANPVDLDDFQSFHLPGWAKGAISFRLEPIGDGTTNLVTETRVWCADDRARRRFAAYWKLINFFSGWIRRDVLLGIARKAEGER
jgi:hypothetical protein